MEYDQEILCTDCRHAYRPWIHRLLMIDVYQCRMPGNRKPDSYDPVTGKTEKGDYASCGVSRLNSGHCGPQGRNWEPKNTRKHMFTMLKKNYDRTT